MSKTGKSAETENELVLMAGEGGGEDEYSP